MFPAGKLRLIAYVAVGAALVPAEALASSKSSNIPWRLGVPRTPRNQSPSQCRVSTVNGRAAIHSGASTWPRHPRDCWTRDVAAESLHVRPNSGAQ
ncbi:hypothetical protein CCHR01_00707 [Colletotrichum chrysophilum]|uniref:Secreted protein n=1 Tax=Colletotrichum chrysophilum TaxID=1836956 RepID=A0AAD9AZJ9_9PEZI|nr:hypothetical protein CCHR01_00707 [Colletotrichum chrysophilum]